MINPSISQIVVIGGGQAGGWACKTLRDEGFTGTLTVVADEPHDFYERPPLSKAVLAGDEALPRLFSAATVNDLVIDWRRPQRAVDIDHHVRRVHLDSGECLPYDRLLIATGGKPRLPVAGWAELDSVLTLRSWDDARRLRRCLGQARRLAVIGGGWIGLEVAASARKLGLEVEVFERQAALCGRSVGGAVSAALTELHEMQGVRLHLACEDLGLAEDDAGKLNVTDAEHALGSFDLAVVGTGVEFDLGLARSAGLTTGQGIVVDNDGATSDPHIFAAGDVAQHPVLGFCLQSWAHAQNQAIVAARGMLGVAGDGYADPAWLWSDQYDTNIQILGIPNADAECVVREEAQGRTFFYLDARQRLSQVVAFNQPRHIKLAKRWLAAQRVLDPDMLGDPASNLMSLR